MTIPTDSGLPPSSLIICSRNRPKLLYETVESVLSGHEVPGEIVIVDQSDQPHPALASLTSARPCQIQYVWSDTVGVCYARNIGLAAAHHDWLVLIDDDMQAPPHWYAALVHALREGGPRCVVTGRVLPGIPEKPGGFVPAVVTSLQPQRYRGRIGTDVLASCHMAMHRALFEAVGPFDTRLGPGTRFPAADDNDYGLRVLERGYAILYAPEAVLYHRAWRGGGDYFRLRWNYGRGKGGFYLKHLRSSDPYMLRRMASDVLLRLVRFPWRVIHRPRMALGDLVYVAGMMRGIVEWLLTMAVHRYVVNNRQLLAPQVVEPPANAND